MRKRVPYSVKLVSDPIQSGMEASSLSFSKSLLRKMRNAKARFLDKYAHSEHAWASSDCSAVSRSFPNGFHLPVLQSSPDMFSGNKLHAREKNTVSKRMRRQINIDCMRVRSRV